MYLEKISLINFKNFLQFDIKFEKNINILIGNNGVGKTTILDAIYYLSFCKSFINSNDSQNIKNNQNFFIIQGKIKTNINDFLIHCGVKKGEKKAFSKNKKTYEKLADHIGQIPLILISPFDSDLVYRGSELRRRFIDGVISQYNKKYLNHIIKYQKALAHRNTLLKKMSEKQFYDQESLSAWDSQLIQLGSFIFEERSVFLEKFILIFNDVFSFISEKKEEVSLVYNSKINSQNIEQLLLQSREKDRVLRYTSEGVHKDDINFFINKKNIKKFGSQGQQKTFLIALKLAQYIYIKELTKISPLLLLDDIFDKLDIERISKIIEFVNKKITGQIFVTDTNLKRAKNIFNTIKEKIKIYEI